MISPINPQRITPTKSPNIGGMFLLFGYGITVVILTLMMMFGLSGDSMTQKKREYFAPVNAKKPGQSVDISDTRDYTAMQLNLNPLEYVLYA